MVRLAECGQQTLGGGVTVLVPLDLQKIFHEAFVGIGPQPRNTNIPCRRT